MGIRSKIFVVIGLAFVFTTRLVAQIPLPVNYHESEGLICGKIYRLHCDQQNYIWISSEYGLFRFDGYKFVEIDDSSQNESIEAVDFIEKGDSLLILDKSGTLYFWVKNSLVGHIFPTVDLSKNRDFSIIPGTFYLKGSHYGFISVGLGNVTISRNGNVEIADRLETEKSWLTDLLILLFEKKVPREDIRKFVQRLDISPFKTLTQIPPVVSRHKDSPSIYLLGGRIYFKDELVWEKTQNRITAEGELLGIDYQAVESNGICIRFPKKPLTLLTTTTVTDCISDKENGVWIATDEHGLFYIKNLFVRNFSIKTDLLFSDISDIAYASEGHFFLIGKSFSINEVNEYGMIKENFFIPNLVPIKNALYLKHHNILAGISNNQLVTIRLSKSQPEVKVHPMPDVTSLALHNDTIYFTSSQGIFYLSPRRALTVPIIKRSLPNEARLSTCGDRMFLITSSEIYTINGENLIKQEVGLNNQAQPVVAPFCVGQNQYLVNKNLGIIRLPQSGNGNHPTEVILEGASITSVCSNSKYLFVSTNHGLWAVPIDNNTLSYTGQFLINKAWGISSMEIEKVLCNENVLIVKTKRGVDIIPISQINQRYTTHCFETEILINGKPMNFCPVLRLNDEQNSIALNFSPCAYKNERAFTFRYIVHPYMQQHQIVNTPSVWVFLPGFGQFKIDVEWLNYYGQWSKITELEIIREKPLYRKTSFYIAILLIIGGAIGYLIYLRIVLFQKKTELALERKENAHLIMAQQLNPHFTFNSLSAIHHFVLTNNREESSRYLTKFSHLMRGVIDYSAQDFVDLESDLAMLKMYIELEMLRFPNVFTFHLKISEQIDPLKVLVPPFLIQPFVENAIRHGVAQIPGNGKIELDVSLENNHILFTLTDNGHGRAKAIQNQRYIFWKNKKQTGLTILFKRIKQYNKIYPGKISFHIVDLFNEENQPAGTKVILVLPILKRKVEA